MNKSTAERINRDGFFAVLALQVLETLHNLKVRSYPRQHLTGLNDAFFVQVTQERSC